ncbi:unnamed protein product, partial [Heterosigma akashiwo]
MLFSFSGSENYWLRGGALLSSFLSFDKPPSLLRPYFLGNGSQEGSSQGNSETPKNDEEEGKNRALSSARLATREKKRPSNPPSPTVSLRLLTCVGKGSFGHITLCSRLREDGTKDFCALKSISKARADRFNQRQNIIREYETMVAAGKHPFVVECTLAFQTRGHYHFELEWLVGGDLYYWLRRRRRFPAAEALFYIAELTLALEHLHLCGVVYRDLKPENVLLDARGHVRVVDL